MANIILNNIFSLEISDIIQKKIHKQRMESVVKELVQITHIFGGLEVSDYTLTSYSWYEFWIDFTDLDNYPRRNFTVLLHGRLNSNHLLQTTPFKTTPRKWLT